MNTFLLCISFAVLIANSQGNQDDNEKRSKPEGEGVEMIKKSGMNEKDFAEVLKWVKTSKICIRDEANSEKTVSLIFNSDEDNDDKSSWLDEPYTEHAEKTNQWYRSFYNAIDSMMSKASDSSAEDKTLKLSFVKECTGGEDSSSTKLETEEKVSTGKAQQKGKKIGSEFEVTAATSNGVEEAVQKALTHLRKTYDESEKMSR